MVNFVGQPFVCIEQMVDFLRRELPGELLETRNVRRWMVSVETEQGHDPAIVFDRNHGSTTGHWRRWNDEKRTPIRDWTLETHRAIPEIDFDFLFGRRGGSDCAQATLACEMCGQ